MDNKLKHTTNYDETKLTLFRLKLNVRKVWALVVLTNQLNFSSSAYSFKGKFGYQYNS